MCAQQDSETPLHWGARNGLNKMVEWHLGEIDVDFQDKVGLGGNECACTRHQMQVKRRIGYDVVMSCRTKLVVCLFILAFALMWPQVVVCEHCYVVVVSTKTGNACWLLLQGQENSGKPRCLRPFN